MSKKKRRRYSDKERAEAMAILDACNGNLSETFRKTKIPITTLSLWAAQRRKGDVTEGLTEVCNEKKRELSECFESLCRDMIDVAVANKDKLAADRATVSAAVAAEKMLLLRGQPTGRYEHEHTVYTPESLARLSEDELANLDRAARPAQATRNGQRKDQGH